MTPAFCRFERGRDFHPVDVNINRIRYLEGKGHTTSIHFDDGEYIVVYGNALSVCMRIQDASQRKPPRPRSRPGLVLHQSC
ncbi:hypothetical protein J8I29_17375 [Labrys sp. LIt4]|uniref:HTH LytTR-type domain-containing protein n=1 Tax=Labrys okinawensis TaxID=346911 RepID=A0A2S9QIH6_9HYPH|nr:MULTISPECIES: hypothetical protein [Labrys]MBP0581101.1 hypothetical protein [Labrys sp. LIt4]PRH89161.1 hypothetical protein C5L14_00780 [Labrys okinawensis]